MKSGQILILVLLIVVVSLAVGLSVASRNLTNLKISTQAEESQRAFSAAEGGVEDALSRLNSIKTQPDITTGHTENVMFGDTIATVKVTGRNVYETTIPLGEVAQVNVDGYIGGTVTVEWPSSPFVALEFTLVNLSGSTYTQTRSAYQSTGTPPSGHDSTNWTTCTFSTGTCSAPITVSSGAKILRIKPFHDAVALKVSGSPDLPTQIYEINSVAKTNLGITRRVKVTRTDLPALPAVFDYVLYSEGDIVK